MKPGVCSKGEPTGKRKDGGGHPSLKNIPMQERMNHVLTYQALLIRMAVIGCL